MKNTIEIMKNTIEKQVELKAPVSKVWRALTDYKQFGEWFGWKLETPFAPGKVASGILSCCGDEHQRYEMTVQKIEPESYFSYTWHPYAFDPAVDYSKEPTTLIEFRLQPKGAGTLLSVRESGFDKLPKHRLEEAFPRNEGGWGFQLENIQKYVERD
jgi:uncharacterized protein YndB with AHSA1/START domain